jgi:LCP family protein required for cell wall assembly
VATPQRRGGHTIAVVRWGRSRRRRTGPVRRSITDFLAGTHAASSVSGARLGTVFALLRRRRSHGSKKASSGRRAERSGGLEALGAQIDAASPEGTSPDAGTPGTVPNAAALAQLGQSIDTATGTPKRRRHRKQRRYGRIVAFTSLGVIVLAAGIAGGAYYYGYLKFQAFEKPICNEGHVDVCAKQVGSSFNVLAIGSDSRDNLPKSDDKYFGGPGQVSGQRSDVVKIFHVDPAAHSISVVSIPRDTMVSLLANQSLFGDTNRINVNYQNGPGLLVRTIEADFGIPINHVVQVGFGGLDNAVNDVGGVWMDFRYPALDHYSSLSVLHTGCQKLDGFEALALARSRHYEYEQGGSWIYDGTSDFGRIDRQDQFLRGLIDSVKRNDFNPVQMASLVNDLPQGVEIDNTFSYPQVLGLAWDFHNFNPNELQAYALPVVGGVDPRVGDVLYINQPVAQQLLVKVFGQVGTPGGLMRPTNPPPNIYGATPQPPIVRLAPPSHHHHAKHPTAPLHTQPEYVFNPVACEPK